MRILVVDDDGAWASTLQIVLQELGHDVCLATDGLTGKAKLLTFEPDLIFLDVVMPVSDGKEFLDRKRESQRDIPVVLISGYPEQAAELAEGRSDIYGVMGKPVELDRIRKLLDVLGAKTERKSQ